MEMETILSTRITGTLRVNLVLDYPPLGSKILNKTYILPPRSSLGVSYDHHICISRVFGCFDAPKD